MQQDLSHLQWLGNHGSAVTVLLRLINGRARV